MAKPKWDQKSVLRELRRQHKAGHDLRHSVLNRESGGLMKAAVVRFGSYRKALKAAGLAYPDPPAGYKDPRIRWDRDSVIKTLRKRERDGVDMGYKAMERAEPTLIRAAEKHFGNYAEAMRQAGIDYDKFRLIKLWDRPKLLAELRRRFAAGEKIHTVQMKRLRSGDPGVGAYKASCKLFGSYRRACEAAGISYDKVAKGGVRMWPNDKIIATLKKLHKQKQDLSHNAFKASHEEIHWRAGRQFGSYRKALEAAGIPYADVARVVQESWTLKRIADELRQLHRKGESVAWSDVKREHTKLFSASERRFGSYRAALRAARLEDQLPPRRRQWTGDSILGELARLHKEGRDLRSSAMKQEDGAIVTVAAKYFGSYRAALRKAGLAYPDPPPGWKERHAERTRQSMQAHRKWDRDKVLEALRKRHAAGEDMAVTALLRENNSLLTAANVYCGAYAKALADLGIDYSKFRRHKIWDKESVVAELRRLHAAGEKMGATRMRTTRGAQGAVYWASLTQFGSYGRACEAAGLPREAYRRVSQWTRERIIQELAHLHGNGEPINFGAIWPERAQMAIMAKKLFGSYAAAVRAAGINYDEIALLRHWDAPTVLAEMKRRLAAGQEMFPGHSELDDDVVSLHHAARTYFGSFKKACQAAGIPYDKIKRPAGGAKWSREQIIAMLRQVRREGGDVSYVGLAAKNFPLVAATKTWFGGYRKALEAAGIEFVDVARARAWTKEEVLSGIKAARKAGLTLTGVAARRRNSRHYLAAVRNFGNWYKALRSAGIDPASLRPAGAPGAGRKGRSKGASTSAHWTEERILQTLAELNRQGEDLRYATMQKRNISLFYAAKAFFGSWVNAVLQAGVDYEAVVKQHVRRGNSERTLGK
jgi:hypothetical protein